jgi:autotransporter translocation and assembly factor TamB
MQITGTLLEPKIGVASGSQVSNEDLLKYLLTGSQVNPLGTTQTNFSQTVLQSLTSTLPSIIPGFRGGGIFEELSLVPTEKGTELSLAKYISRSLYVRYSQRLSVDPGRTIGVEYYLNDNVSLNVTRGVQGTQKYEGISFDLNLNFEY